MNNSPNHEVLHRKLAELEAVPGAPEVALVMANRLATQSATRARMIGNDQPT